MNDLDEAKRQSVEYAKKHSAFEIGTDKWYPNGITLSVTQNGNHWTTVNFVDAEEAVRVANALLEYVKSKPAPAAEAQR